MTKKKGNLHHFLDFKKPSKEDPKLPMGSLCVPPVNEILRRLEASVDPRAKAIIDDIKRGLSGGEYGKH